MGSFLDVFLDVMRRGGPVLWLLLVMSIVTVTLIIERVWYWAKLNSAASLGKVEQINRHLRAGDHAAVRVLIERDESVYAQAAKRLIDERVTDAMAMDVVESRRAELERFMPLLSTLITAAPMLGLLGTVTGLINTFKLLSDQMVGTDPRSVGMGLSEALINTAAGLLIAIMALFPYNAFKVQVDRSIGRLESMIASAASGYAAMDAKRDASAHAPSSVKAQS
jgi:biopolymer transport protein ExbB